MSYIRKYRYRGGGQGDEHKRFWLLVLIGLAIGAGIVYFF
jgi:hypothetical protein